MSLFSKQLVHIYSMLHMRITMCVIGLPTIDLSDQTTVISVLWNYFFAYYMNVVVQRIKTQ